MPMYEYKCPECGKVVEQIESSHVEDTIAPVCRHYDSPQPRVFQMRRVQFSRTGSPQFKGDGFYSTDYRDKK
jgi:putative FmdB family regulatory protein